VRKLELHNSVDSDATDRERQIAVPVYRCIVSPESQERRISRCTVHCGDGAVRDWSDIAILICKNSGEAGQLKHGVHNSIYGNCELRRIVSTL
jgi:hypothetical protein